MKITDITSALVAFKEATNNNTVSEETAIERGNICRRCPLRKINSSVSNHVSKILAQIANKHGVSREIRDYSCSVCGCNLGLLIPALPEHVHKDSESERKRRVKGNPKCWVLSIK